MSEVRATFVRLLRVAGGRARSHVRDVVGSVRRGGAWELTGGERAFIAANARWWQPSAKRRRVVLVDGLLGRAGPNYLLRTGSAARLVADHFDAEPVVVLDEHASSSAAARALYASFGIRRFHHLRSDRSVSLRAAAVADAARVAADVDLDSLIDVAIDGVVVGDLIYDDLLRARQPAPPAIDANIAARIYEASRYVRRYRRLLAEHEVAAVVVTHGAYVAYGGLARVAAAGGVPVFETTDGYVTRFATGQRPCYHEGLRNLVDRALPNIGEEGIDDARGALAARFAGTTEQFDVRLAYRDKRRYSRASLRQALGITDERPLVFVLAHVLVDSPHISARLVHRDYEHWLAETLAEARVADAHLIVKQHPSSALYGEGDKVARLARAAGAHVCPDDFNTASIVDTADAVLTVQGTAGLEFACVGVPVAVAGRAFYAGFGFTHEPATRDEHRALVRRAGHLPRLDRQQQRAALRVFAAFHSSQIASEFLPAELLERVWGYHGTKDVDGAYAEVAAALATRDPRSDAICRSLAQLLDDGSP